MAIHVNDNDFEAIVLQAKLPVLVDFWAPWCGPCRAIAPIIDELTEEYAGRVLLVKINVDDNAATAGTYGIRAIPTLILFDKGEMVEQCTGAVSKMNIVEMLKKRLSDEAV